MVVDLTVEPPLESTLSADVCIVGAGPAGIVLALELARARPDWQILLLEAGGRANANSRERAIYGASTGSLNYASLDVSRRRMLGGTTAHWGGWSKPLDATDYSDNPRWDVPAWPFGPDDIASYVDQAVGWAEIDDSDFSMRSVHARYPDALLPLDASSVLGESLFRFSPPTRFGDRYYQALVDQDNLRCILQANLIDVDRVGDKVVRASVKPLDGEVTTVSADVFVMAMGGLETTRYLLNLRGERAPDGFGIYSSHLGRYFADHVGVRPGVLLAPAGLRYHRFADESGPVMPVLTNAASSLAAGEHNCCMMLDAIADDGSLLRGYGGSSMPGFRSAEYWHYRPQMIVEPRPFMQSRVQLSNARCELGLQRIYLDWQIHADDFHAAQSFFKRVARELGHSGLGRARVNDLVPLDRRASIASACHHMGTTRMAKDPRDGVVDENLKVFDCDNLYIASSSVFPRYGFSNPTLMVIALSVKLAQHLAGSKSGSAA